MITVEDIQKAHERIRDHIHHTPVFTNHTINELTGAAIYFKCENFQKIGAFKARGGLNAVLQVAANNEAQAITTHSSGNHAQAVAYAAKKVGLPAYIVMPKTAPIVKKNAVLGYGAEVIECEPTLDAREAGVKEIIETRGAVLVHPFDNDRVIAGQATAAKELIEDSTFTFDTIITPVGGGGLLSGTSLSAHYFSPSTKVVGAEPEGAADAVLSFKSGKVEKPPYISSIADGLLTTLSERTLAIIREHVSEILLANDEEIAAAMKLIWERMKIIVEPSSAVALAVIIKNKERFAGQRIGIIISGGNVDLATLPF
ncbi:threonine ammonia-lyase [Solitalea canadensis]|uniref:Threonine dehydratase n=1 Tax=Solitalea canadensis (strain ATCC 29591 / DSM 3403 / JCM 21819 / LMG 8368 / NBRC 15130 / NCIMB 12057 / USAM 9D) TaxID=929556 RepID=H8KWF3_SOLCM|nr:threonine/serine dehydratase [Solitalea canadensis]AFD07945.1 threonine dehydratase [Solitalea canadensis DSM 3403]